MIGLYRLLTRWWTAFALAASLALLGAAHAFERFGGLPPCNLCLKQREVYWGAVAVALIATLWTVISRASRGTPRVAAFVLFAIFATGMITAGFHAGGEMKLWALPATCSGGGGEIDLEGLAALALGTGEASRPVMCDAVTWRFAGLSMAGWNTLIAGGLGLLIGPFSPLRIFPEQVYTIWSQIPGVLISVVFATLFLGQSLPSRSVIWQRAASQTAFGMVLGFGQYLVGGLVGCGVADLVQLVV
jgi:disulfide bond formation protein DsbB